MFATSAFNLKLCHTQTLVVLLRYYYTRTQPFVGYWDTQTLVVLLIYYTKRHTVAGLSRPQTVTVTVTVTVVAVVAPREELEAGGAELLRQRIPLRDWWVMGGEGCWNNNWLGEVPHKHINYIYMQKDLNFWQSLALCPLYSIYCLLTDFTSEYYIIL